MGAKFLIDTNTVIEFIGGKLPEKGAYWLLDRLQDKTHCLSAINQIELLGYNGLKEEMSKTAKLISGSVVLPISEAIVLETIKIRKQRKIKIPDAIIAATAIVHKLTIVSRNEKDFKDLKGVKVINLHKL